MLALVLSDGDLQHPGVYVGNMVGDIGWDVGCTVVPGGTRLAVLEHPQQKTHMMS
jgi:hypothetical protein